MSRDPLIPAPIKTPLAIILDLIESIATDIGLTIIKSRFDDYWALFKNNCKFAIISRDKFGRWYIEYRLPYISSENKKSSTDYEQQGPFNAEQMIDYIQSDRLMNRLLEMTEQYRILQKKVRKGYIDTL